MVVEKMEKAETTTTMMMGTKSASWAHRERTGWLGRAHTHTG